MSVRVSAGFPLKVRTGQYLNPSVYGYADVRSLLLAVSDELELTDGQYGPLVRMKSDSHTVKSQV